MNEKLFPNIKDVDLFIICDALYCENLNAESLNNNLYEKNFFYDWQRVVLMAWEQMMKKFETTCEIYVYHNNVIRCHAIMNKLEDGSVETIYYSTGTYEQYPDLNGKDHTLNKEHF